MANKLADARRSLIRAKESAKQRLQEIENERREIRASLKSLDAALKALGGDDPTGDQQASGKPRRAGPQQDSRRPVNPSETCATGRDVPIRRLDDE
jgi:hypothetical protein